MALKKRVAAGTSRRASRVALTAGSRLEGFCLDLLFPLDTLSSNRERPDGDARNSEKDPDEEEEEEEELERGSIIGLLGGCERQNAIFGTKSFEATKSNSLLTRS